MIFWISEFPEFKFYIQVRFKLGSAFNEIFKELKIALSKGHPSFSTLTRCSNQFKRGLDDLKDKHLKGVPITETIHVNIERVRGVIENDSFWTYDEIKAETVRSCGTLKEIIQWKFIDEKISIPLRTPLNYRKKL